MTLEDKCATGWAANEQAARQHVARVGTRVVTSSRIRLYQKARARSGFDVGHAEVVIVFASELQNVESSCSDHSSPGGDRFAAPLILVRCRLSRRYPSVRISDGPAVGRGCHRRIEAGPSPLLLPLLHFVPGQLVVVATHPQLPPPDNEMPLRTSCSRFTESESRWPNCNLDTKTLPTGTVVLVPGPRENRGLRTLSL